MKTLFKKSLVALALTGAAMSVSAAPELTAGTNQVFSLEGLQTVNSSDTNFTSVRLGAAAGTAGTVAPTIELNTAVPADGLIRVTFNTNFTTGSSNGAVAPAPTLTTAGNVTLNLANAGSNFYVYRAAANVAANDTFTITTAKFPSSVVAGLEKLTVSVSTEQADGTAIEATEAPLTIATVVRQGTAKITQKLAGTIDVAQQRVGFTDGSDKKLTTVFTDNQGDITSFNVVYKASTHVVKGDFSFIKDTKADTVDIQPADGVVLVGDCTVTHVKATEIKASCAKDKDFELGFDLEKNTASKPDEKVATTIAETSFTLTSTFDFSNARGLASNTYSAFQAADAGSFELNGSNVQVPYMVFGTVGGKAFSQVININNASSVAGDIYVDVFDAAGTQLVKNKKLSVKAAANSVTSVAGEIKDLISGYNGRASVKIVTETPSASTQVYAAYVDNVTTERAIVVGIK